jgi:thiol-disulfide isomerase/thioredoxin
MSTKALIGILLAGTTGILIFLFVHLSGGSNKITIGAQKASACDTKHGDDCLPDVKYVDTTGKAYTLASLGDKIVVVNFWATWCHPCQQEIPALSKVYDSYKDKGVVILGVMADNPADAELLNFQSDHEMSYPIVRGNSDLLTAFSYPQALPTTFVYDRGHRMVGRPHVGAISSSEITATLDELVAQK